MLWVIFCGNRVVCIRSFFLVSEWHKMPQFYETWEISSVTTTSTFYVMRTWVWCVCINSLRPNDAYMRPYNITTLLQIMACRLFGTKPLSEAKLPYCQPDPKEHISVKFYSRFKSFHSRKCTWKCRLPNVGISSRPHCVDAVKSSVLGGFMWSICPHSSWSLDCQWDNSMVK